MYVISSIAELKAKAGLYPPGYVDYLLAHGRAEGDKLILDQMVKKNLPKVFPELEQARLEIAQLKAGAKEMPEGYVDYLLARGKIEGSLVILDWEAQRDIRAEYPFFGFRAHNIAQLKATASQMPEGLVDYVLVCGKIEGDIVILDPAAQRDVREKYFPPKPVGANLPRAQAAPAVKEDATKSNRNGMAKRAFAKKVVVYTAAEGSALLKEPPPLWRNEANFVVFQEAPPAVEGWKGRRPCRTLKDPARNILRHKILSHVYFPKAEYSLWMDGSVMLKTTLALEQWIAEYLGEYDLAVFAHPLHNCCYQEGVDCIKNQRDAPLVIDRQLETYNDEGYPPKNGLADCAVLFRRHTPAIQRFNELWHDEIKAHSHCEQLSFGYAARKARIKYARLPGTILSSSHFSRQPHAKILPQRKPAPKPAPARFEKPHAIILSHPRSGTHFLQATLASHPKVHLRDEFIRRYFWTGSNEFLNLVNTKRKIYANKPFHLNIGIVMYQDVEMFEKLFCPLAEVKIIHLLRNPRRVARSYTQMWADIVRHGKKFRYHWGADEEPLPHAPLTADYVNDVITNIRASMMEIKVPNIPPEVEPHNAAPDLPEVTPLEKSLQALQTLIGMMQEYFSRMLTTHPDTLEVNYDAITGNAQVNQLPEGFCREILGFLGLDYQLLTNKLKKVS